MFIHKKKINLIIIILILITSKVFSLDITIPLKIYEPLSKSISTQIPGSSFIIIDKNDIEKFSNAELANIIDLETGI